MKRYVLSLVLLLIFAGAAQAQQQTGEIFGKATDQSGGVLPGVTVTLTAPHLLQPLTAVTSETGTYQFPRLEIGTYTVRFELTGFKTQVNADVIVTVGFSAQINAQLGVSTVQETITVTGQSPIVDTKDTGTKQTFTNELLQSIPSARDPWVILQQTAGIAMDRENIGGNMSGQQSNYVSRGGNPTNNKWSLDGVDITDQAATGGSPGYFDFDAFEEMTVNTGGVDVTQQTGGVGINLVTKSGTDKFRGSTRFYDTNQRVEANNITDTQRTQGASSGNPIQDVQDYGIEAGGPIKPGKAWIWGSFGKQLVDVGVLGFYQPTAACQQIKADQAANPLAHSITDVNDCLNTDETLLVNTNLKAEVQLFKGNKLTVFNNFSKKDRNARGADDLHPIETTTPQGAVPATYGVGTKFWTIGPSPTYKAEDQYVLSDRLLMDVQWAHVGNNFILDFHDPSLATVQPTFIINSPASLNGRSGTQTIYLRPANSVNVNMNYFLPGGPGGDHALKLGGYWRDNNSYANGRTGGNATARFPTAAELASANDCATLAAGCQAALTRDSQTIYDLTNISAYVQDTITHNRLTLQLGVRYDRNHDQALASNVPSSPLMPALLPAVSFAGADPGIIFNNFSPRVGFTFDLNGDGKTLLRANYASYWGQVGTSGVSFQVNPVSAVTVRYGWLDANHDKVIQANEVYDSKNVLLNAGGNPANFLAESGNWDPANPGSPTTKNTIDPNLKNDRTDEIIVGVDRQIGAGFAVGGNFIYRNYANFSWSQTNGVATNGSSYTAVQYTAPASTCPAGATCPTLTYYQPIAQLGTISRLENREGYSRSYNGVEVTGRKRLANRWLMNTSFSYNDSRVHYNGTYEDPTNITMRDGFQYDYQSTTSGIANVYVNARWMYKISGMYQLPADVNISAFYNTRQGYLFERTVTSPSRANGAGTIGLLLDGVGDSRLPTFQNLDFHVERPVKAGAVRFVPAVDVFNVFNSGTEQALRGTQNSSNANYIQAIVAPRVLRFGVRVTW
jgi:carboxypeptidase family protein/TonB-dependent receptor-like protein